MAIGATKLRLPLRVRDYQKEFLSEVQFYLDHFHPTVSPNKNVEKRLVDLASYDRNALGRLYKVSRRFPSVRKIASSNWGLKIAREFIESPLISCCNFVATRFDLPGETKYLTESHQDFPYIQGSVDGITIWIPFSDADENLGPPSFISGSHLSDMSKVIERGISKQNGTSSVESVDLAYWGLMRYERWSIEKGSALVMHTMLVHRSEPNMSDSCRLSLQIRFDNLLNEKSFQRNYPDGLYLGEKLSDSYPEFVELL